MFSRSIFGSALALLVSSAFYVHNVAAQVTTSCQPLNTTGCPADPAFGMDYTFQFNSTPASGTWDTTAGRVTYAPGTGAAFTINKQGDSPTIRTKFYIFFGRVELWIKAAPGTGIISSAMFLSDDLDEIDWEFMGGNVSFAESNYFGKGRNQDFTSAIYYPVNGGVQADYHNYTTVWTKDALDYYIDGQKVRTLLPKDANNTNNYPQTPMRLSLGIWAGGDPTLPKGTRDWAGGDTDYSKGPFTMYVRSAQITDYSSGKEYSYGDHSGSWQSIKIATGNSTAHDTITAPPPQSIADKWNNLSPVAHIAIYASAGGVGAAFLAFALYYCIKQRRRGAKEAKLAEERMLRERMELEQFKKAGVDPDSFAVAGTEYDAKEMRKEGMVTSNSYSVPASPDSGHNEKAWATAAAGGAAAAMRSPMPLLRDGAQSPRVTSPSSGPYGGGGYGHPNPQDRTRSPAALVSPMRTPSPGMPPNFPPPANPASRSFSTPTAQMRVGSPGPQRGPGGYAGAPRTFSPSPMGGPGPQRSFTSDVYRGNGDGYRGNGDGYRNNGDGYRGNGGGYGGNSGYGGAPGGGGDGYWR